MKLRKVLLGAFSAVLLVCFFQGLAFFARKYGTTGFVCNAAGPFGVEINSWLIFVLFLLGMLFFIRRWWFESDPWRSLAWLFLLSAGASNFLERLFRGCVFDFLSLPLLPLFNGADVILTLSVVFLLWREVRRTAEPTLS